MADAPAVILLDQLSDDEKADLARLRGKMQQKETRNRLRSNYYDGKHRLLNLGFSIPPQMKDIETVVGWPAKAVDALEHRLNMDGFVLPVASSLTDDIATIMAQNNMQVEASQAHVSALTHGTAFAFTTAGDTAAGDPDVVISIRSARQATAVYNRRKRRLDSALEVVTGEKKSDRTELLYRLGEVITLERSDGGPWQVVHRAPNPTGRVLCTPLIHRPFIEREFGMSRITRAVMSLTDTAVRTILRTEVSAEFFSSPQRYLLGADESSFADGKGGVKTGWEAILGRWAAIPNPEPDEETGETPHLQVGQFPQASMQPHTEHLRSTATMFAGETAIPVSYLGIIHDNPASADAINAGTADLVGVAERDIVTFGSGWVDVAQKAIMVRDGVSELPEELTRLRSKWRNPATPTRQAAAQSVMSLVSTGVYLPDSEVTWEQLGLDQTTIDRLKLERRQRQSAQALERLTAAAANVSPRAAELAGTAGEPGRQEDEAAVID